MLFLKPIADLVYEDVEQFCMRFKENIRVEYKSTFDENVKNKLPRVISGFANSYGGILIIGVNANNGIPEIPTRGIKFTDPEPRLTLENICRAHIVPEVPIRSKVIESPVAGNAFLVVEIDESPKAPHAIENSTRVYVRSGDSTERTVLADLALTERLLLRRREVLARWDDFYKESFNLAHSAGMNTDNPLFELRIGPRYPTESLISRENTFSFLNNYQMQHSLGLLNAIFRHPTGALLAKNDEPAKYLNIGELGTVHYLEPLRYARNERDEATTYPLWWITGSMMRVLNVAATLMASATVTCDLRIEAKLANVSKRLFTLQFDNSPWITLPVSVLSKVVPASLINSSENMGNQIADVAAELLYQLRWPFGTEASHTREQIRTIVNKVAPSANVVYQ